MTYYNSARSKNFIIFTDDDNKTYTLDVNTGIFTNNQTNKPIKRFPVGFGRYLDGYNGEDSVIRMMRHIRNNPRHYGVIIDGYVLTTLAGFATAATTGERLAPMLFSALAAKNCLPQSIRWKKSIIYRRKRLTISMTTTSKRKALLCGSSISPALATT